MPTELAYRATLVVTTCWCGMRHAIPEELYDSQKRQHRDGESQTPIYCPLGHQHIRAGEGEAAKLRVKLEAANTRVEYWRKEQEATELRRRAAVGQLTRAKKRARGGVCPTPACNRSFVDVARHVRSKHPHLAEA